MYKDATPPSLPDREPRNPWRFQFGIWHLLLLTFVCAVILALVSQLGAPVGVRLVIAGYFMVLGAYVVLRALPIAAELRRIVRRLRQIREDRDALGRMAAEWKRELRDARPPEKSESNDRGA